MILIPVDNTFEVSTIDHNLLLNTHNLTTDIDHDALTNFSANKHLDWTGASTAFQTTSTITLLNNNTKFFVGANSDASFYYDGTHARINPKEVGAGSLFVDGHMGVVGTATVNDLYSNGYVRGIYATTTTHMAAGTFITAVDEYRLNNNLALWAPEVTSNGIGIGTLVNLNTSVARYNLAFGSYSQGESITGDHCSTGGPSSLQLHTAATYISAWGGDALKGYNGIPAITHVSAFGYGTGFYSEGDYCLYLGDLVGSTNTTNHRVMIDMTNNATPWVDGHLWDGVTPAWMTVNGNLNIASTIAGALVIGVGTAGIDYNITFNGETNDGILTWMEDEDYFKFLDDVNIDTLTASGIVTTDASKTLVSLAPSSAYTPTNVIADRAYDANSTTTDELADVLGTLIADLQTANILA